jgi:hypothetical protein
MTMLLSDSFRMKNCSLSYFCCSSQSTWDLKLIFVYFVVDTTCRLRTKIGTKLWSKSSIMIYLVFMLFLP